MTMANPHKKMKCPIFSLSLTLPFLLALGWSTGTWGAVLTDPTRPPQIWLEAHGISFSTTSQETPSGVQLIMIGPSKKFALVNGQIVMPGKIFNGSKVLDINSDGVVTKDASKSLKLIPAVKKKVIPPDTPKESRMKAQKSRESANENGGNQ